MLKLKQYSTKITNFLKLSIDRLKKIKFNLFIIASIILLFTCLYIFYPFYFLPIEIFDRNLGHLDIAVISFYTIESIVGVYLIYQIIYLIHSLLNKKINYWFWGTILIILFLFYIGTILIDNEIGIKNIELKLLNKNGTVYADRGIVCRGRNGLLIVGEIISCEVLPNLKNISMNVTLVFKNGTKEKFSALSFTAPDNLNAIYFEVEGIDSNNDKKSLSVYSPYYFLTHDEYRESRNKFISYLSILFGILFVTVPYIILNFRKLSKND